MTVRTIAERFRVPHTFNPDLSPATAAVAVLGALARIFLGSVLFALWGVSTALMWTAIGNPLWGWVAVVLMVGLFVAALGALMLGISSVVRALSPK